MTSFLVYQTPVTSCRHRHASQALNIHPTAVVSEEASISTKAEIGPFCVVAGKVEIGAHTVVESHVRLGSPYGEVIIGEHNHIQSGSVVGGPPQHRDYADGFSRLVIGHRNRIGEGATLNLGSESGGGVTSVGDRVFLMASTHIGHDCRISDDVVVTNLAHLGGHVEVGRKAVIAGMVAVTQHVVSVNSPSWRRGLGSTRTSCPTQWRRAAGRHREPSTRWGCSGPGPPRGIAQCTPRDPASPEHLAHR